ncbi:hypothetical protein JCM10212_006187 [Sporobolomyces blumeae]
MYNTSSFQPQQYQPQQQQQHQPTFASGAFASPGPQQQQGARGDAAILYGQQATGAAGGGAGGGGGGGGGGGQAWGNGTGAPSSMQGYAGYAPNGQQYGQAMTQGGQASTASLFQQQLQQQQQQQQHGSMAPSQQTAHAGGNNYQTSAQAYMQTQQALANARQAQQQQFGTATPYSNPSQLLGSQQTPQSAAQAPPNQQRPNPMQPSMSAADMMQALRGVNVAAMTAQQFAALTPIQQAAFREYTVRSRAHQMQQQAQLGLGLPSSPSTPTNQKPQAPNQSTSGANGSAPTSSNRPIAGPPQAGATTTPTQLGFLKALSDFYQKRGIQINSPPLVEGRPIDLPRFYAAVTQNGGFMNTNANRSWGLVATALGFPAASPNEHPESRLQQLASAYHTTLFAFEQALSQAQQQARQLHAARAAGQASGTAVANGVTAPLGPASSAALASTAQHAQPPSQPSSGGQAQPSASANAANARLRSLGTPDANNVAQTRPGSSSAPSNAYPAGPPPFGARPSVSQPQATGEGVGTGIADVKGKGKAFDDQAGMIKAEENALNASPAPLSASLSTPKAPFASLAATGLSALQASSPRPMTADRTPAQPLKTEPVPPAQPPRRKRQKIEYVPFSKVHDAVGGYDLAMVEEVLEQTSKRKRPRTAYDLGLVDLHSLTMSLRSRLASEVSFALNSLTLISMSIRSHPQENNVITFPLARCRELYEELVDLLEETAFGFDGDAEQDAGRRDEGPRGETEPRQYRDLFRTIVEEAGRVPTEDDEEEDRDRTIRLADEGLTPLRPSDVLLSILNILRNFSIADDNAILMGRDPVLLDVLLKVAHLPLKKRGGPKDGIRWPVRVAPSDSMTIRKDVLELVTSFGLEVRLEGRPLATARRLFDLLAFFLLDAEQVGKLAFDLSSAPGSASRLSQPPSLRIAPYVDLALAAFARITLPDTNRTMISRLAPQGTLERLFDSLMRLLPISEPDFQILTNHAGLLYVENLAMALYNLAYVASPELKMSLRSRPGYIRGLLRVVKRLSGASPEAMSHFQPLTDRCIATLSLLSSLGGVTVGSTGIESSDVPWWGMSMSGWDADDEAVDGAKPVVRPAQPTEADRGTVKQRFPPSASAAAGLDPGPPVLAGETRSLLEGLATGSLASVFGSVVSLV